jgi:hypothetical protein
MAACLRGSIDETEQEYGNRESQRDCAHTAPSCPGPRNA